MKLSACLALIMLFFYPVWLAAQGSPVEYMDVFTDKEEQLSTKYLSYMSEVAHGRKARKLEKRRIEVVNELKEAVREAAKMKPFNGDVSLRDAYKNYWNVTLSVFNED